MSVISRSTVISELQALRRELQEGDEMCWEHALLLYDVCDRLGLSAPESQAVLSAEIKSKIDGHRVKISEAAEQPVKESLAAST